MRAFEVLELNHDLLNNTYKLSYCLGFTEVKKFETTFNDTQSVKTYLYETQRNWLLTCLENYVTHKKHIFDNSNYPDKKTALKGWQLCLEDIDKKNQDIKTICQRVLKGFPFLEIILPSNENSSYENSKQNLVEIKKFCDNYLRKPIIIS